LASEITENPKKWWTLVSETMGTKKTTAYPSIVKDGIIHSTDKEKAEAFNETYIQSSSITDDPYEDDLIEMSPDHELLEEIVVTEQDVKDILKTINTNKAYGPDNISPRLLKEAGPSITAVLVRLFNKSLELAKFPLIWKRANVLPIFKKAEAFITTNYRPVSLLSILAKVFEKIAFKYLFNYFRTHFMISIWQSGFLPGTSTVTQLVEIYDQFCKAVNAGKEIRVVFLDISKAFDRVWHKGLLHKLRASGISGKLLDWLKDYLSNRQQRVMIDGVYSEWGNLNAGVPQGSVLGPLLFLIFINDITHVVRNCKIRLFADDTCLFIEVEEPDTASDMIEEDLENLSSWANKWKVNFSPPKTEEMVITRKRVKPLHRPVSLNNVPVTRVEHHKHLGLTLSKDLTWKVHVNEISDKAVRRLGILRSLKYKLNKRSLEKIYKGLIRPILEYGDIVWHNSGHTLDCLEKVQMNAARIVTGATAKSSSEGLYNETSWEPLADRRAFHRLVEFYKILNDKAPTYLKELLPEQVNQRTTYMLRNRGNLDIPRTRLNCLTNSFFPSAARSWNELSQEIKSLPTVNAFKNRHASQLSKSNPLYYSGGRLENCMHARLRIKNSPLKADLFNELHVIDSPLCPCGAQVEEDAEHFFLECPLFDVQRRDLQTNLLPYVINNCDYLLYGVPNISHQENLKIFTAVQAFIRDSKRFY
jgi:hypothetical protein